jgi:hypothetical protein
MMTNEMTVDELVKRTYRYFYDDGLAELAVGLLFALTGIILVGWHALGSTQWVTIGVVAATVLLVAAGPLLVAWAVRTVKGRVTYPRTGYVAYRAGEPGAARWLLMGAAVGVVVIAVIFPEFNKMPFIVGSLVGLIFGLMGYRVELWRLYPVAVVAVILGILMTLLDVEEVIGTAITFAGTGVLLLAGGGLTLFAYVRQHPDPNKGMNDG